MSFLEWYVSRIWIHSSHNCVLLPLQHDQVFWIKNCLHCQGGQLYWKCIIQVKHDFYHYAWMSVKVRNKEQYLVSCLPIFMQVGCLLQKTHKNLAYGDDADFWSVVLIVWLRQIICFANHNQDECTKSLCHHHTPLNMHLWG